MNWGRKLILVFIAFATLMSTLVYMCNQQKFELVSKDYYTDELHYQDRIDGAKNAEKISGVEVRQNAANLIIALPKELNGVVVNGQAWFYCPTDAAKDKRIDLQTNAEGKQFINKELFAKAKYTVKINWKAGNDLYYSEKSIQIE